MCIYGSLIFPVLNCICIWEYNIPSIVHGSLLFPALVRCVYDVRESDIPVLHRCMSVCVGVWCSHSCFVKGIGIWESVPCIPSLRIANVWESDIPSIGLLCVCMGV